MRSPGSQGWLIVAGFCLAALGFARQTKPNTQSPAPALLPPAAGGNADSNNRMIAVTGTDITGSSILYLVDTVGNHLAVYQATGGGETTQGLKFVGARNIDLDLQLDGWNDNSTWTYKKLRAKFEADGLLPDTSEANAR